MVINKTTITRAECFDWVTKGRMEMALFLELFEGQDLKISSHTNN